MIGSVNKRTVGILGLGKWARAAPPALDVAGHLVGQACPHLSRWNPPVPMSAGREDSVRECRNVFEGDSETVLDHLLSLYDRVGEVKYFA